MPFAKQDLTKPKDKGRPKGKSPETIKKLKETLKENGVDLQKKYKCCACGMYSDAAWQFPASNSSLYVKNDKRLPICNTCINSLYDVVGAGFTNHYDTYRRICMMYDIYYNDAIADVALRDSSPTNRVTTYITCTNVRDFKGKTYANTIIEETNSVKTTQFKDTKETQEILNTVTPEVEAFWGFGLYSKQYNYLQNRYDSWVKDYDVSSDPAYKAILQKICLVELKIQEAMESGEDFTKLTDQFNKLLSSANLQPKQKNGDKALTDSMCFGNWIKECEATDPIPEPLPEFQDVDGVSKYVSVWFLGHLCKMLGINNKYSRQYEYETEIKKYTVEKPTYEDDEENVDFDSIFGNIRLEGEDKDDG